MARLSDGAFEDFGDPERSVRAGIFQRLAHLLPWALVLYLGYSVLRWVGVIDVRGWLGVLVELPLVAVLLASLFHVELARLCLLCAKGMPLNPDKIRRRDLDLLLRWSHRFTDERFWYLKVFGGLLAVEALIRWATGITYPDGRWLDIPADLFFLGSLLAFWRHHRYKPWCPYCKKWDDGGQPEHVPDPDPAASKVA